MLPTSFSVFILLYSQNDLMTVFLGEAVALRTLGYIRQEDYAVHLSLNSLAHASLL